MTMTRAAIETDAQAAADAAELELRVTTNTVSLPEGAEAEDLLLKFAEAFPEGAEAEDPTPLGTIVIRLDGAGDGEISSEDLTTHLAAAVAVVTGG